MGCSEVFDALGFERVNASGEHPVALCRWRTAGSGMLVSRLSMSSLDGMTDVPKSQRTGCYVYDLLVDCGLQGCVVSVAETIRVGYRNYRSTASPGARRRRRQYELDGLHQIVGRPTEG